MALEQERVRIAADMHDVIAHSWAVVAAQADGARYTMRSDPDRTDAALAVIGETARTAMTDVRSLLTRLREPDAGVGGRAWASSAPTPCSSGCGPPGWCSRCGATAPRPAGSPLAATAGRVLAEALTNALKHGDLAAPVCVEEAWGPGYRLTVTNAVDRVPRPGDGHGLRGVRERVAAAGGRVEVGPAGDGATWVLHVEVPAEAVR